MSAPSIKPVVLISVDGMGVAPPGPGNAITSANTPNLDRYWPTYPHTYLEASGVHVGLPSGTDGNSEVGHTIMGAGKIIFQDVARIDNAINHRTFFENPELKAAFNHARKHNSKLHIMGLIGSGKAHSSLEHMLAVIKMAALEKMRPEKVFLHLITDGRDSAPDYAPAAIERIQEQISAHRIGTIVSVVGRMLAMDRDRRWERIQLAYNLYTKGSNTKFTDVIEAVQKSYQQGVSDEFIQPASIIPPGMQFPVTMDDDDAIIFTNFRPDRAIEITRSFLEDDFTGFIRDRKLNNIYFVGMSKYGENYPPHIAFPPEVVEEPLGKVISDHGLKQVRVAESEKFAHVTYFFNNGYRGVWPGETQLEVPSPKDVLTYDLKPDMSQRWCTDVLLNKLNTGEFSFALLNFAGPDMVGHTGKFLPTVRSMEVVDECIGRIVERVLELEGTVIITADHGNAEEMIDSQTGQPDTEHSTNPVPCIIIKKGLDAREIPVGNLADIAPTILGLLGIPRSLEMTGRDLLAN